MRTERTDGILGVHIIGKLTVIRDHLVYHVNGIHFRPEYRRDGR